MHIVSLSPSSMDSFQGCHNKFFIEQVLKWRSGNIKAGLKGTILHEVMETLAKHKFDLQNDNKYIVPADWAYVEELTRLTFEKYQQEEPHHNWKPEDKKECIKWAKIAYESKYNPINLDIFEIEKFFEIELCEPEFCYTYKDFDGNDVQGFLKLRGVIDLVIKHDDTTLEILDWKSGQRKDFHTQKVKEIDDLYDDTQLLVYLYAVKQLYNFPNILVTIFYLREGPFTLFFGNKHVTRAKEKILEKFEAIKATQKADRDISWKCGKLCDFNQRTFEGTHIKPFIEFRDGEFTKPGENMSICQQVNYCNDVKGLDWSTKYLKKK
jgi:ATP-dependent helicase/DNAse subunit B